VSHPAYPATPLLDGLPPIGFPLDHALLVGLLLCLAAAAVVVAFARALVAIALLLALLLAIWDQSRWQPWFFQYALMLAALFPARRRRAGDERSLDACRAVVAGLYVWSGAQKLNATFAGTVFPWFAQPVAGVLPLPDAWWPAIGLTVPLIEIGVGIALLTPRARQAAVVAAVAMHAAILLTLGPLGHATNPVVWPWNVAMALLDVTLFWRAPARARRILLPGAPIHAFVALLALVMPALSFAGLWDAYLSGALYSGNVREAVIAISPAVKERVPADLRRYVTTNRAGAELLVIGDWSMGELGVPPYPELRVYRSVARAVCGYARQPSEVALVVFGRPDPWTGERDTTREDCAMLGGS
jgi:methylamine utilization protein MauE